MLRRTASMALSLLAALMIFVGAAVLVVVVPPTCAYYWGRDDSLAGDYLTIALLGGGSFALLVLGLGCGHLARRLRPLRRAEECRVCGYDLRGDPMTLRCPECGAQP